MIVSVLGRAALGVALVMLSGVALAGAPMPPATYMAMSKAQYQRHVDAQARSAPSPSGALDRAGPVMTRLDLVPAVDLELSGAQITYSYEATDNLAGVRWLGFVLTGPSGQVYTTIDEVGYPRKRVSGMGALGPGLWTEDGLWQVTEVRGQDNAGNLLKVPADLGALGNLRVQVRNPRGTDTVAPTLVRGRILSPTVSLSAPWPGTESGDPLVGIAVTLDDSGQTISGVGFVSAEFCSDFLQCMYLTGPANQVIGLGRLTMRLITNLNYMSMSPDVFYLQTLTLSDQAGNERILTSRRVGGETDFSKFFPTTTIELLP